MTEKIPLFNGNNEAYLEYLGNSDLPDNWSTCPLYALDCAFTVARQYKSKMAVLCYLGLDEHFAQFGADTGCNMCQENTAKWYNICMPLANREERERNIRIYKEKDLAEFVEEHLDEGHKDSLNARKYYNLIFPDRPMPSLKLGIRLDLA